MKTNEAPVVVQQSYEVPAPELWKALTELDQMREWFFWEIPAFEARQGFETQFEITNDGRVFNHCWRIEEVIANTSLVIGWSYEGYDGEAQVRFDVEEVSSGTSQLTLTCIAREDFSDDVPEFRRESAVGGWEYFLHERLPEYFSEKHNSETKS